MNSQLFFFFFMKVKFAVFTVVEKEGGKQRELVAFFVCFETH